MSRLSSKKRKAARRRIRRPPPGASPGTIALDPAAAPSRIRVISFGDAGVMDREATSPSQISLGESGHETVWINIDGVGDGAAIAAIGERLGLHMLTVADICNVYQRPKVEEYADYLYIVVRMPQAAGDLHTEQMSICLKANAVATFQEYAGDCFDPIRERLKEANGRFRRRGADYLAYAILDAAIDSYFPLLETLGERLEAQEEAVLASPHEGILGELHSIRRSLLSLRRAVWPLRDPLNMLLRSETPLISAETRVYLRDCYDHVVQLIDLVEAHREMATGLMEVYLSQIGQRTNEVMKVLAIIGTVFMPLTFIAGVYGMNFSHESSRWNMPELYMKWGYPLVLLLMAVIGLGTLWCFRRFGWIGGRRRTRGENGGDERRESPPNEVRG